ncbi:MAG: hypothetical protein ACI8QD_000187 [Cyclobacteriaceae bacterium]|jgi:hypothetical protein
MEIKKLNKRPGIDADKKLGRALIQFEGLLTELRKKDLPAEIAILINDGVEQTNAVSASDNGLSKQIRKAQSGIIRLVEKELKIVTKNHYRNSWLVIGMSAFGIPIGVAFGSSVGNMGFLGLGLPIGMVIGIAVGAGMDKKAFKNGKQLDIEIKG